MLQPRVSVGQGRGGASVCKAWQLATPRVTIKSATPAALLTMAEPSGRRGGVDRLEAALPTVCSPRLSGIATARNRHLARTSQRCHLIVTTTRADRVIFRQSTDKAGKIRLDHQP
jgi:hypothetical protein